MLLWSANVRLATEQCMCHMDVRSLLYVNLLDSLGIKFDLNNS